MGRDSIAKRYIRADRPSLSVSNHLLPDRFPLPHLVLSLSFFFPISLFLSLSLSLSLWSVPDLSREQPSFPVTEGWADARSRDVDTFRVIMPLR